MGSFEQFVLMIWFFLHQFRRNLVIILCNSTLNALVVTSLIDYCVITNIQYMKEMLLVVSELLI